MRSAHPDSGSDLDRSRRLVIPELVARSARRDPDAPALAFEEELRTFGQLEERANRLAGALAARGVGARDNVAILMHNRIEFVESFLGVQLLGACAVPVNFRLSPEEVEYVLGDSNAVAIIADGALAETALKVSAGLPAIRFALVTGDEAAAGDSYAEALAAARPTRPQVDVDDEDLAFLMYTSGTTGRPKGAMLSHQNLVVNTMNWLYELGATPDDVWLSGSPLFHIGGVVGLLPFLHLGALAVIEPSGSFAPQASISRIARHRVSMCFFVPTQWHEICDSAEVARIDPGRLRVAMWGASSAPLATLESMSEALPAARIVSSLGQTEMSGNTCFLHGEDSIRKLGSVGRLVLGVEARIVDEDGIDVPRGEVGEILYRSPTAMQGYWGAAEATAEVFAGGWLHSGDLVREDEEGFVYVVDRRKDMLISGGENVYPAEIERVLLTHPGVAEVAVVGVAHPRWVETPLAVIVPEPAVELTEDELIEFCRERLAGYKKPSAIVFVEDLPRNPSGKVLKRILRERYAGIALS